jgi:hypothetical protein
VVTGTDPVAAVGGTDNGPDANGVQAPPGPGQVGGAAAPAAPAPKAAAPKAAGG